MGSSALRFIPFITYKSDTVSKKLFDSLVVLYVVDYVEILIYLLGHLECSVERMSDSHHSEVCHVHYLESHLRAGSHDRVGAVRAVADDDVLAAGLLELEVVLDLSRAVARGCR